MTLHFLHFCTLELEIAKKYKKCKKCNTKKINGEQDVILYSHKRVC